jgi:propanol-preferring alcohol dehydrogenase
MKKTMKAAILHKIGDTLRIEQVPIPAPGRGEVLIKVIACGVCHSDLHAVDGDWSPPPTLPLIPGHEIAGHIVGLGESVTDLKVGDAVGVPWMYSACGKCEFCLAGMETICKIAEATGYSKPGGYAEYMVADAAFVARLPKNADFYQLAPILCAGVTTYRGLKRTNARPGQWVAVVGIGVSATSPCNMPRPWAIASPRWTWRTTSCGSPKGWAPRSPSTAARRTRRKSCRTRSAASTARS